jgi:hypothetical protein
VGAVTIISRLAGTPASIPPAKTRYVDVNSVEIFENGSELYPYKTIQQAIDDFGRPVDGTDAFLARDIFVFAGTYSESPYFYTGREIHLIFVGRVAVTGTVTIEIDGATDQGAFPFISTNSRGGARFGQLTVNSIVLDFKTTGSNSFQELALSLSNTQVRNPIDLAPLTKINSVIFERDGACNGVINAQTTVFFGYDRVFCSGTYDVIHFNGSGFISSVAGDTTISATGYIYLKNVEPVRAFGVSPNVTLTAATVHMDLASYDLLEANSNLTITTPGSLTIIDSVPPENELYIDPNVTRDYKDGSIDFPFSDAATARAANATAALKLSGIIENSDVDTGTETVDEFADTVGYSVYWLVQITKGTNYRKLAATAVWDAVADTTNFAASTIATIGTIDITLSCDINANNVRLLATATTNDWAVTVLERIIR